MIAVLVPTLGRPQNIARVAENLDASLERVDDAQLLFVVEAHDAETMAAIDAAQRRYIVNTRSPSYAGAINTAVAATTHPYLFIGSDDLDFHRGWLPPLLEAAQDFGLVGTNDLHNPEVLAGLHATHYLVSREYAERGTIDDPSVLLHEGYVHNYCDTEAVETARFRAAFTPCLDSVVEHRHWLWMNNAVDATYAKSRDTVNVDQALYRRRRSLWTLPS